MLETDMNEGFTVEMANLVAVWVEMLLYGIYICLFVQSMYIMSRKARENITSVKVFFIATVLLFVIATCDVAINLYRLLRGYIWLRDTVGPVAYFNDFSRWDSMANNALLFIMTWIGDALVIYRCWIIWNYNYYVIIIPAMLMTISMGVNTSTMYWFTHLDDISFTRLMQLMNTIYPLAFVQNTLATGLIAGRIWMQHRASARAGVHNTGSRLQLGYIGRIVVESAMVYTVQLLVLIVLYALQHNAQFVLQLAIVPSIGIVFNLIAVRLHHRALRTMRHGDMSTMPDWMFASHAHMGSDSDSEAQVEAAQGIVDVEKASMMPSDSDSGSGTSSRTGRSGLVPGPPLGYDGTHRT